MHRQVLLSCLPYVGILAATVVVMCLLVRLSGTRLQLRNLLRLHGDQQGGVQSLSFVLTLPLFVMLMMFIVQLTQITIARIAVEYAAFAAARSTMVWIPANLGDQYEEANQIATRVRGVDIDRDGNSTLPYKVYSVRSASLDGDLVYSDSRKCEKIHLAAAMACMAISPSRNVGVASSHPGNAAADSILRAYDALDPSATGNARIPARLRNKLAYALLNTRVRIEARRRDDERIGKDVPLSYYDIPPHRSEYQANELGWQDQIFVAVSHDFALLPGPARILARRADALPGTAPEANYGDALADPVAQRIRRDTDQYRLRNGGSVYVYELRAEVRLSNEGEKSVLPYIQGWRGVPPQNTGNQYNDDEDDLDPLPLTSSGQGGGGLGGGGRSFSAF